MGRGGIRGRAQEDVLSGVLCLEKDSFWRTVVPTPLCWSLNPRRGQDLLRGGDRVLGVDRDVTSSKTQMSTTHLPAVGCSPPPPLRPQEQGPVRQGTRVQQEKETRPVPDEWES